MGRAGPIGQNVVYASPLNLFVESTSDTGSRTDVTYPWNPLLRKERLTLYEICAWGPRRVRHALCKLPWSSLALSLQVQFFCIASPRDNATALIYLLSFVLADFLFSSIFLSLAFNFISPFVSIMFFHSYILCC